MKPRSPSGKDAGAERNETLARSVGEDFERLIVETKK